MDIYQALTLLFAIAFIVAVVAYVVMLRNFNLIQRRYTQKMYENYQNELRVIMLQETVDNFKQKKRRAK